MPTSVENNFLKPINLQCYVPQIQQKNSTYELISDWIEENLPYLEIPIESTEEISIPAFFSNQGKKSSQSSSLHLTAFKSFIWKNKLS